MVEIVGKYSQELLWIKQLVMGYWLSHGAGPCIVFSNYACAHTLPQWRWHALAQCLYWRGRNIPSLKREVPGPRAFLKKKGPHHFLLLPTSNILTSVPKSIRCQYFTFSSICLFPILLQTRTLPRSRRRFWDSTYFSTCASPNTAQGTHENKQIHCTNYWGILHSKRESGNRTFNISRSILHWPGRIKHILIYFEF